LPIVENQAMRGSFKTQSAAPGEDSPAISRQRLRFTLAFTSATNVVEVVTPNLMDIRCDRSDGLGNIGAGCVYPEVEPVFLLNGAAPPPLPEHAAFVASAQASLPGNPGAVNGTPLHREGDPQKANNNRAVSCRGFVPDPNKPNDSCDEYPFATTKEGGAAAAVGHVPTHR